MIEFSVFTTVGLFFIACLVGLVARKFGFPYSIGLVLAGFALSMTPVNWPITLSRELVFAVILPPLIFESAMSIKWGDLRRNLIPVVWFSVVGLAIAALVTAWICVEVFGWPWPVAFVFGALISTTDPVSVVSTLKEAGVKGNLKTQVEGESLANDGMSTLLYVLGVAVILGGEWTVMQAASDFVRMLGGGILVGFLTGQAVVWLIRRTDDHLIEIGLTTIAAFLSFILAEKLNTSGMISCMVAGITVGYFCQGPLFTQKGQSFLHDFWEFFAFVINSLIFLLVGLAQANQNILQYWKEGIIAFSIILFSRAVSIYGGHLGLKVVGHGTTWAAQHVLFWGGIRGALSLVLAMSLPESTPYRDQVVAITFFVVGVSLILQGLTMRPLLRRLKVV